MIRLEFMHWSKRPKSLAAMASIPVGVFLRTVRASRHQPSLFSGSSAQRRRHHRTLRLHGYGAAVTYAVVVWIWGVVLFFAVIPGAVFGWIVGALLGSAAGLAISFAISVIAAFVAAEIIYPGSNPADYLIMFIPPFLVASLLGVWISSFTSRRRR